jgi:hypothetical protein
MAVGGEIGKVDAGRQGVSEHFVHALSAIDPEFSANGCIAYPPVNGAIGIAQKKFQ